MTKNKRFWCEGWRRAVVKYHYLGVTGKAWRRAFRAAGSGKSLAGIVSPPAPPGEGDGTVATDCKPD